ncbi:MAG: glycosyltransferase family 39 protein [Candidatus Daviesbacteria bacterium]|nr:glycosyltransferase family 39 protein [Candidatus Daviesbacteria bacterium]
MSSVISYFKKKPYLLVLIFILIIGLFFRTYKIVERFEFAHDGDLYSWIVKDIVVNHHFRLIGQLTSVPGIFIGGLFYYLLIPFFLVSKMDPIGVFGLGVLIGVLTILSYYFILTKLFNKTVGILAAFLHAVLLSTVGFDRWIVPTLPTKLWAIWYFYTLIMISRGNFSLLPILGILIGLIWHIHIALLPALLAIPAALFFARKLPNLKQTILFFTTLLITSSPLILFEVKHRFIQTQGLFINLSSTKEGEIGLRKLMLVLEMISKNTENLFLSPQSIPSTLRLPFLFIILSSVFLLIKYRQIKIREVLIIFIWLASIILFFSFSRTQISEYYFANLEVILLTIVSLIFALLIKSGKPGLGLTVFIFGLILVKNILFFVNSNPYQIGYLDRKAVTNFIEQDVKIQGYPCIGITYITRPGENVGFRYFFYLNKLHLVHPSIDVPVYNIVIPEELSKEVKYKFGHIGIIPPTKIPPKETIQKSCQTPNTNLTDPMWGYVD